MCLSNWNVGSPLGARETSLLCTAVLIPTQFLPQVLEVLHAFTPLPLPLVKQLTYLSLHCPLTGPIIL